MSLFTSNFKQEAAALSFVALALLTCELGLRASIQRASIDVRHIRAIPKIVAGLAGARHPTFLFLGNSLTRSGVIPEVLAGTRAAGGFGKAHVALIHPDDTTISDWLYLYERFVRSKGAAPDVLLIGFAKDHLSDSHALHVDRLGGYFGGLGALPEAFSYDVPDLNGRVSYLLSSLSCAYANRDRVRTQVFESLIPYYKASAQDQNKAVKVREQISTGAASPRYKRLTRFLGLFKGTPTKVVFIAIPVPAVDPIDPSLESVLKENSSQLIDLRRLAGLTERDYLDGYHLTPHGGAVFTRELSRRLLDSRDVRTLLKN